MKKLNFLLLILCIVLLPAKLYSQKIIASFEDQKDLLNIQSTPGIDISWSTDFPALGAHTCKAVFPEKGGTLFLRNLNNTNWSREEVLHLFIWSNETTVIDLVVEDSLSQTFINQYSIKQGANHVQLSLSEAKKLDLEKIKSIGILTKKNDVFYFDYISLDQFQPVLAKLGRWDTEYTTKIKTQYYPWGSDLASGTIKSYSISPVFDGRGIIELAERLDLDFKVATIGRSDGANRWGFGDFYARRDPGGRGIPSPYSIAYDYIASDLLFSKEFDVIIWPGIHNWDGYPQQIREAILDRVKNGTGLVLLFPISDESGSDLWNISPLKSTGAVNAQSLLKDSENWSEAEGVDKSKWAQTKQHYITRGVAFEAFPWGHMGVYPFQNNHGDVLVESTEGNPILAVSNYGKGRIVAMAYPERGFLPRVDDPWETGLNYPYWEYMWSFVARSVVWASNKEPEIFINNVTRTAKGISVNLSNVRKGLSLNVQVTDDFGVIEEEISTSLSSKKATVNIKFIKELKGGKHIVNVQLKEDKGVYDWYSLMFQTPKIAEIVSVENNELEVPVGKKVQTGLTLKTNNLVKGTLVARLYDNYGRLVDENTQEVSFQGEKTFKTILNSDNILTHLGKSEFLFYVNGIQTDHKTKEIFFLQPRLWDDYDVTMYHFGPNPVPGTWTAIDRQLQELNVTTLAAYTLSNSKHANYKVQAQTRIKGVESPDNGPDLEYYEAMKKKYLETKDKSVLVRKYGLCDSAYLNSVKNDLINKVSEWKKFSPSAYYIYEEPSITRYADALDLDFSITSLKAMREWLKEQYISLKALNDQWGTNFTQWLDVIPDDSREARERGNYSSWADHRTFMEICWADQFKFVQETVNKIDPGGLVQLSGTQAASSHNGYDYSRINQYVGQMNPYNLSNQLEYHHNFNPDLKISGQAGYGALGEGVLYDYYNHLFLKETGGSYVFWQVSCLNPDLTICQSGLDLKAGFDEILKRGIGKLITSYQPENDLKIAIHFSYPSIHAAWIVDGKIGLQPGNTGRTLRQFDSNRDGWVKILHEAGYGFDFISYSSIEKGNLISKGYKVLILPMSLALSDKEVQQIKDFVNQGGILIADALAGVMDDHTKFRSKRELSDVFGIETRSFTREELVTPVGESDLKIKNATVLLTEKNKPEILYNKYGKGSAFLLNYFMDNYPEEQLRRNNESSLMKIRKLFEKENLKSGIILTTPDGTPSDGVEKYPFSENSGSTRLLGLLPGKTGEDKDIHVRLNDPVHLYDIRNKKYLGFSNDFKIRVKSSVPEFFGLVKGTIDEIKVEAPTTINRGDKVFLNFTITGKGITNLKSVIRVDVFNPDGEALNYYSDNCEITNNSGTYNFITARNDKPGLWKIRLTEVISGVEKELSVTIN